MPSRIARQYPLTRRDEATARLTFDFYSELLKGRSTAHALREATRRSLVRNPEHARPFYWSSVVLVGGRRR